MSLLFRDNEHGPQHENIGGHRMGDLALADSGLQGRAEGTQDLKQTQTQSETTPWPGWKRPLIEHWAK